jgi:hypothetical protein
MSRDSLLFVTSPQLLELNRRHVAEGPVEAFSEASVQPETTVAGHSPAGIGPKSLPVAFAEMVAQIKNRLHRE